MYCTYLLKKPLYKWTCTVQGYFAYQEAKEEVEL